MERTRRDAEVCYNNGDNCQSTLTRFVWAGDQLLWELRVPGGNDVPATSTGLDATSATGDFYGRVSYFHAGGIDRPLLITKEGAESVVPRETWRGQFHAGTSPSTGAVRDCPIGVQTGCLQINWPGMRTNASHSWGGEQPDIRVWYGGLVDGMRDASGQMYMRNRYYDPATGQFTQTDPIGIAGGMNVYGFAAGDPVTYSDPYGLCPKVGRLAPLALADGPVPATDALLAAACLVELGTIGLRVYRTARVAEAVLSQGEARGETEPTLPPSTVVDAGEIQIEHYYHDGDHGHAHMHVTGGGRPTKIGPNGRPVRGAPELTRAQARVVNAHLPEIRRAGNKIGRWLQYRQRNGIR